MRDVDAAILRCDFAQLDQFLGLRVECGGVDQRGGHAQCAFRHCLPHERLHALEFSRGRRPVLIAEFMDAHRGGAHEGGHIRGNAALLEVVQIFAERGPAHFIANVALLLEYLLLHLLVERAFGPPLAENLQRHPLADVTLRTAILQQADCGPTQHVDEAGCHRQAAGINFLRSDRVPDPADCGNGIGIDGDVAGIRLCTAAVVNHAIADDEIVPGLRRVRQQQEQAGQDHNFPPRLIRCPVAKGFVQFKFQKTTLKDSETQDRHLRRSEVANEEACHHKKSFTALSAMRRFTPGLCVFVVCPI